MAAALQQRAWGDHDAGRYAAAMKKADRAFTVDPNPELAMLRAGLHKVLDQPCDSVLNLLLAADMEPNATERGYIDKTMPEVTAKCDGQLGWIRIEADAPDALVTIAGQEFVAPRTLAITAGQHQLTISAPGRKTQTQGVQVRAGIGAIERFSLSAVDPPEPVPPPPVPEPVFAPPVVVVPPAPKRIGMVRAGAVLLGLGVGAVGTGIGMSVWGQSAVDAADDLSGGGSVVLQGDELARWNTLNKQADRRQTAAAALYAVGGATAVTGAILLIVGSRSGSSGPTSSALRIDPIFGPRVGAQVTVILP
ncbi:MAG: hypothetical protein R3F39_20190 [Myxococcota bacterium]